MKHYLILFVSASLLFVSCEKEIKLKEDEIEPRIVLNGLLTAGDTIRVQLSESRNVLYDQALPSITTGVVELFSSSGALIGTFTHEVDGIYVLNGFTPAAGNSYSINASFSTFKPVSAVTEVPSATSISSIDTNKHGDIMKYEIKFNDVASETNYYAVTVKSVSVIIDDFTGDTIMWEDTYYETAEIFTQNGYADVNGLKWGQIFLFSDASFNGQECSFSAEQSVSSDADTVLSVITVHSISESYYKYKVSLEKYQQTEGDPFAQPVQVFSNVENGFGVLGGYSFDSDTLIIN
ncbi:MAG: DUF4249 domain-containing protein [Crocinitomicaceae bacterium]|nr:DUF4249 domain-containing protein [Crocinitomicaceae bacterium]